MDLQQVREEIAELLRTVPDLRAHPYNPDPGALHFPAAVIMEAVPDYNTTFGATTTTVRFAVALMAGGQITRATQQRLDGWLANTGPYSVRAALEEAAGYQSFDDLSVEAVDATGFEDVAELGFFGATLTVAVHVSEEQP